MKTTGRWPHLVQCAIFVAILALSLTGITRLQIYDSLWTWLLRVLVVLAISLLLIKTSHRQSISDINRSIRHRTLGTADAPLLDPRLAVTMARRVGHAKTVTALQAQVFALAITNPASMRPRLVESYQAYRRTLRQQVTVELQLPNEFFGDLALQPSPAQPADLPPRNRNEPATESLTEAVIADDGPVSARQLPVPIVINYKGELNDDFWIMDHSNSLLHKLAYSEYLELAAGVLHLLLFKAAANGKVLDERQEVEPLMPDSWLTAELRALRCIMQRGERQQGEIAAAVRGVTDLRDQVTDDSSAAYIFLAAKLVRKLGNRYAVVAPVSFDSHGRADRSLRTHRHSWAAAPR
jgi:hypothetical protein